MLTENVLGCKYRNSDEMQLVYDRSSYDFTSALLSCVYAKRLAVIIVGADASRPTWNIVGNVLVAARRRLSAGR